MEVFIKLLGDGGREGEGGGGERERSWGEIKLKKSNVVEGAQGGGRSC